MKNRLANVVRGRLEKPMRIVIFGGDGVGKSTFAARAPAPIFVGAEDGTATLDIERMPDIGSWRDITDALAELESGQHGYRTVVLDTLDWAEPMLWDHVCSAGGKASIEDFGYGKGYIAALDEWRRLLAQLDRLRDRRGMHVVLIAHAWIKPFKNPDGDDYDRYEMKLHAKASGLIREWADMVLFANHETLVRDDKGRKKGVSTGARIVHTERRAAWDAKNRYGLPETMPLDWDALVEGVAAHAPESPEELRKRIVTLLDGAAPRLRPRVEDAVKNAGDDARELARIENKLRAAAEIREGKAKVA
jgi:hypothetical protein